MKSFSYYTTNNVLPSSDSDQYDTDLNDEDDSSDEDDEDEEPLRAPNELMMEVSIVS